MFNNSLKLLSTTILSHTNDLKISLMKNSSLVAGKYSLPSSLGFLERKSRNFHTTGPHHKEYDRRHMINSMPKLDDGTLGETLYDIDTMLNE